MAGTVLIVIASLLGAGSCVLIAWSIWTKSKAGGRPKLPSAPLAQPGPGQVSHHAHPAAESRTQMLSDTELFGAQPEPATAFMSEDELFAQGGGGGHEPRTTFLTEAELLGEAGPDDSHEVPTAFMTEEELLAEAGGIDGDSHEVPTAFMTEAELLAEAGMIDEDSHEVPTAFMTEAELLAEAKLSEPTEELPGELLRTEGLVGGRPLASGAFESSRQTRAEGTVVLSEVEVEPEPDSGGAVEIASGGLEFPDDFDSAPSRPRDRMPVHRIPLPPEPEPARRPEPKRPSPVSGTLGESRSSRAAQGEIGGSPRRRSSIEGIPGLGRPPSAGVRPPAGGSPEPRRAPPPQPQRSVPQPRPPASPRGAANPGARPPGPPPRGPGPAGSGGAVPPSRLPAQHGGSRPSPGAGSPARARRAALPDKPGRASDIPDSFARPPTGSYSNFVGAPLDDDDDDDDDDDPETELVHQAELLRLMGSLTDKPK